MNGPPDSNEAVDSASVQISLATTIDHTGMAPKEDADEQVMDVDGTITIVNQPISHPLLTPSTSTPRRSSSMPAGNDIIKHYRVGYVSDDRMMLHAPLSYHPEMPARIQGIYQKLKDAGCLNDMRVIPIRKAVKKEVLLVHSEDHWDKVQMIALMDIEQIVMSESYYDHLSLYVNPKTTFCAELACGGVIEAALAVARGELEKSFAIVRPPGHHAEPEEHMGFCFFNNVAIATRVIQQLTPMKRVLILDWDVHHGNGTHRAFSDDPSVLYISIHRFDGGEFYPGGPLGSMDSCGEGAGEGTSVNIPWPDKGMGDAEYLHAFMKVVMPIAMEFAPEIVMISAGFDSAEGDPLGECNVSPAGFAHMTHMLSSLAGGKLVVALEGGYNVNSISRSALAVTRVLLGDAPPDLKPMVANEIGTETVWAVAMHQSKYWKSLDPKSCEPRDEFAEQTISISELLKLHRQEHLYQMYKMVQVPLLDELEERFQAQALCSQTVLEQDTLVLFVHQFGNLRVEMSGALTCDVSVEYSFLIDVSKDLLDWVTSKGYGYIEVNTYPRPALTNANRTWKELGRELITYLWDNYIQLATASEIVVVGHGPGCMALMELLVARAQSVMKKVKAAVLVVGESDIPQTPQAEDGLRAWYLTHSFVAVPETHSFVVDQKIRKKHGSLRTYDEPKAVKLLAKALPDIENFVESKLANRSDAPSNS